MRVWIIFQHPFAVFHGIFSTLEKAQLYKKHYLEDNITDADLEIIECDIDENEIK